EPLATLRTAVDPSTAAFAAADLDAVVHLSFADLPCREYLLQMLTDAEVHGWDLATALGQDRTLDPEVVDVLLPSVIEQQELIRGSGMFGAEVPVPADADPAVRLLALLGRE
ncbi:MAG: TIGR03086 family metal-binding protein, partial [Acidimicrobiales bacterium]